LALLLLVPAAAQGGGERRPRPSPVVVDGAGRVVGAAAGNPSLLHEAVAIRVGDVLAVVLVARDRFLVSTGLIGFETSDCLGTRWLIPPGSPGFFDPTAIGPGNVLHGATGDPVSRPIASLWNPGGSFGCVAQPPTPTEVFDVTDLLDLDVFEPPFRLE
jgi:hypothetical protein